MRVSLLLLGLTALARGASGLRVPKKLPYRLESASQIAGADSNCHPLDKQTKSLFVTGWDGGSLNQWLSFAWDHEWLYAKYVFAERMPVHFIKYPGYCHTYQLRNDWDSMQKYVCMGHNDEWLRAGCGKAGAIPVQLQWSNGKYKMKNMKHGQNYISYSTGSGDEDRAIRSIYSWGDAMTVTLRDEPNLLAPYKVEICYFATVSIGGGSDGRYERFVNFTRGKTETKTYEKEVVVETSISIDASFPFTKFVGSASASSTLKNSAKEASSVTTNSMRQESILVNVSLSLPCYIYQTKVTTTYRNNGKTEQWSANTFHQLRTPVEQTCVTEYM